MRSPRCNDIPKSTGCTFGPPTHWSPSSGGGQAQDRCDQANEASRQRAVPGVQDRQKDQPMLEVVKRTSELDESGAGGLRIHGWHSPAQGELPGAGSRRLTDYQPGTEFPQLLTQALQLAQYNVNAICPGLL